ncbi:hypothetical protein GCM10027447_38850 [Glycomyces halotolerans]
MNVVVVGAGGNIGTALLRAVSGRGWDVTGVSRRPPGRRGPYRGVRWIACDIGLPGARSTLTEVFAGADAVVHLAWAVDPLSGDAPMARTNLDGTANVLSAAADAEVPHLVAASSAAVYSPGDRWARVDERAPRRGVPRIAYSLHKAALEDRLDRFARERPQARVARIRPCGAVQADSADQMAGWLLPRWTPRRLIGSGALPVPLWPGARLQLVHAADVAEALVAIVEGRSAGAFNLAAEPVLGSRDLAAAFGGFCVPAPLTALRAAAWPTWRLGVQPLHPGWLELAERARLVDASLAGQELGWSPRHDAVAAAVEVADAMRRSRPGPSEALSGPGPGRLLRPSHQSQRPRPAGLGARGAGTWQTSRDESGWCGVRVQSSADVTVGTSVGRDEVFERLADGWSYPAWVVGASHVREVDDGWPDEGTRIHHNIGPWPLHIKDVTEVLRVDRPRLLVLRARMWPVGEAIIRLELFEDGPDRTVMRMVERAIAGPPVMVPMAVQARLVAPRNRESLERLASLATGRARQSP